MNFYVYILKCLTCKKSKTYVGYTNNLKKRLLKHNTNKGAKTTKGNKWKIVFTKKFTSKSNAMKYEYNIKKNRKKRLFILKQAYIK